MRSFISLFIFLFIFQVAAKDTRGWTKKDVVEVSWKYIQDTKKEFQKRSAAVEKEIGEKVELNYRYFHNMDADQKKIQDNFLKARLSTDKTHAHINAFLEDLELNRQILAKAEEKAKVSWEKKNANKNQKEDVTKEASIYGTKIKAKRLGVILDTSGSMSQYLGRLREEIKKEFPNAYFIEIYGSFFKGPDYMGISHWLEIGYNYIEREDHENPFLNSWYCPKIPEENPHYLKSRLEMDNIAAMAALSHLRKVDAIYWFSDMKDRVDSKPVETLLALLKRNKTKVYAHTTGKYPTRALSSMIKGSGGKVIRKKIK